MNNNHHSIRPEELLGEAGRLEAIARRLCGDNHAAEDLVQDTWVAALQADCAAKRDSEGWRAWAGAVTRNLALRRVGREGMRAGVEREAARREVSLGVRLESQRELGAALLRLDEPYRSALVLRYMDGLSHGQIAERQGVSNANARQRVSRAMQMLRKIMGVEVRRSPGLLGGFAWTWKSMTGPKVLGGMLMGVKTWTVLCAVVVGILALVWTGGGGPLEQRVGPGLEVAQVEDAIPLERRVAVRGEAEETLAPAVPLRQVVADSTGPATAPVEQPKLLEQAGLAEMSGFVTTEAGGFRVSGGQVTVRLVDARTHQEQTFKTAIQGDGSYLFDDLPPGELTQIKVRASGFAQHKSARNETLLSGSASEINITVPSGLTVTGVVRDAETGRPVPFAEVWADTQDFNPERHSPVAVADGEGRYWLRGVEGDDSFTDDENYFLVFVHARAENFASSARTPVFVSRGASGECKLDIDLAWGAGSLQLFVRKPDGSPAAAGMSVSIIDHGANFNRKFTDSSGKVTFKDLALGRMHLAVTQADGNESEHPASLLTYVEVEGGPLQIVELVLKPNGETVVEGFIVQQQDGAPVALSVGVEVIAQREMSFQNVSVSLGRKFAKTDRTGFKFLGLDPGLYKVWVAGASLPREVRFDLKQGGLQQMDFQVGEAMQITGQVELGSYFFRKLQVVLRRPNDGKQLDAMTPKRDGSFSFKKLPRDHYVLTLVHRTDGEVLSRSEVPMGQIDPVVLFAE